MRSGCSIWRSIYLWLLPMVAVLTISCDKGANGVAEPSGEVTIAYLKSLCTGERHTIVGDCYIRGVVVANDWLGEFYKSIVVVDDSGGIEIAIESESISSWLPIYSEVEIFCGGMELARVGGKVELGSEPTGDFLLDNIDESRAQRVIKRVGVVEDYSPRRCDIGDIELSDISSVVWIEGVRVADAEQGLAWCDVVDGEPQTTMRTLVDGGGSTLGVRTLATSAYATQKIPSATFAVVGVVDASGGEYFLRIINQMILF